MYKLRKCINIGLLAVVAGSVVSFGVQAGQSSSHGPAPFSEFDKDGSGYVSEEEFTATRGQRMAAKAAEGKQMRGAASAPEFTDIDTDGDGLLSPGELTAAQKAHMKQMGKGQHGGDHKGQGKGMKARMPTFSDFDLDGNGIIIESEFNQAHARKVSEMAAAGRQMKHVGDAPGFSGIDTNNDDEISEQEFTTHQAEHHKMMHKGQKQVK